MTDYLKNITENLGITEDEAREEIRDLVEGGKLTVGAVVKDKHELPEVPWETLRKAVKPPKGLSWEETKQYYREHAHEVWSTGNPERGGWTWFLIKDWQKDRTKPYARGFFLVDGFASELGDAYWADVIKYARRVR